MVDNTLLNMDDFNDDIIPNSIISNKYDDEIDISETKAQNRLMQLQQLISQFEYRLAGGMWKSNGEKMYWGGNALAGEEVIQKVTELLHAYSREIVLLMNISTIEWAEQMYTVMYDAVRLLTRSHDSAMEHSNEIFRSTYDLFKNIGHIVCNSNFREFAETFYGLSQKDDNFNDNFNNNNNNNFNNGGNNGMDRKI